MLVMAAGKARHSAELGRVSLTWAWRAGRLRSCLGWLCCDGPVWERIEPLMPSSDGQRGRPFRDHRQVVEGIIYRFRTGIAWRDLPACVRAVADRVEAAPPVQRRRDLGQDPRAAGRRGRRGRGGRLDGVAWTPRSTVPISTARPVQPSGAAGWSTASGCTQGAESNYKDPLTAGGGRRPCIWPLSRRAHRPRSTSSSTAAVAAGDRGDRRVRPATPRCCQPLLAHLAVARIGPGRPRTRPERCSGTRPTPPAPHRSTLRARGIKTVIPQPADQIAPPQTTRLRAAGDRPTSTPRPTNDATSSSAPSTTTSSGADWPPATTSSPPPTRGALVLATALLWLKRKMGTP